MNIGISACFIANTRYDGQISRSPEISQIIELLKDNEVNLLPLCPEQLGGLTTPRHPAEISGEQVLTANRVDVSNNFIIGANQTLKILNSLNIDAIILKEFSPSCASQFIYDGTHSKIKIKGVGITTKLLRDNGITVFSEFEIEKIKEYIWKQKT